MKSAVTAFSFFFFSPNLWTQVEARSGFVVAKKPESEDDIAKFDNLVHAYGKYNRTIDYKNQDEWDKMTSYDFEQYDAVVVVGNGVQCPSSDNDLSSNPFSNYLEWGDAVKHGNVIILATKELELFEFMDKESSTIVEAAVAFSLYRSPETGAIISLGPTYYHCDGLSAVWLNQAFGLTSDNDKAFEIVKNYSGRNFNSVVESHPALQNLNDEVFERDNGRSSSMAMFVSYPNGFVPFAVVTSYYNSPFILLWEGTQQTSYVSAMSNVSTKSPTIMNMSSQPSSITSSSSCEDNISFFVNGDPFKTCEWIGKNLNRITKFCGRAYVVSNCPSSCNIECTSYPSKIPSRNPTRYNDHTMSPSSYRGSNPPSTAQSLSPSLQITSGSFKNPTNYPSRDRASSFHPSPSPSHDPSYKPSSSSSSMITYTLVQQVANFIRPCKETKSSKSRLCIEKLNRAWKTKSYSTKSKKSKKSRKSR
jgi:hypothetical protein